ncbi:MAG TPA: hypothetical protein VGI68_13120 [Mycobacterium sp.]
MSGMIRAGRRDVRTVTATGPAPTEDVGRAAWTGAIVRQFA